MIELYLLRLQMISIRNLNVSFTKKFDITDWKITMMNTLHVFEYLKYN
jgi:hypothetical protein